MVVTIHDLEEYVKVALFECVLAMTYSFSSLYSEKGLKKILEYHHYEILE